MKKLINNDTEFTFIKQEGGRALTRSSLTKYRNIRKQQDSHLMPVPEFLSLSSNQWVWNL